VSTDVSCALWLLSERRHVECSIRDELVWKCFTNKAFAEDNDHASEQACRGKGGANWNHRFTFVCYGKAHRKQTNKQTNTHTRTHTHIYIYIRTRIPTYIYPHMHAYTSYIRACIHTYIYLVKKFPTFNETTWFIIVFTGTLTDCTSSCPFLHHLISFV